jgi:hypothetical protein
MGQNERGSQHHEVARDVRREQEEQRDEAAGVDKARDERERDWKGVSGWR